MNSQTWSLFPHTSENTKKQRGWTRFVRGENVEFLRRELHWKQHEILAIVTSDTSLRFPQAVGMSRKNNRNWQEAVIFIFTILCTHGTLLPSSWTGSTHADTFFSKAHFPSLKILADLEKFTQKQLGGLMIQKSLMGIRFCLSQVWVAIAENKRHVA